MTKNREYFKIFCNVNKAFGSTMSEEALLALIVQSAVDTMAGKSACLFLADEVVGVLSLYSEKIGDFPQDALIVMESLAHLGALAIQNASMYLLLQKEKDTLEDDIQAHRSYF